MSNVGQPGSKAKSGMEQAIEQNLRLLMQPAEVHEIRILGAMGRNRIDAGYFDDPVTAARAVLLYDGSSSGIYITLNPVLPDLLARGSNRMVSYAKDTTRDQEIARRVWFLIDLDAVRLAGISSSDAEHQAALDRARATRDWLRSQNWPDPKLADSGNGAHLLYRIDLPNDVAAQELLKACLVTLQDELSTDAVTIDTSVYNAGRLTRVYGTLTCKGDNLEQRPHRRSKVLEGPGELIPVPQHQLEALAARSRPRARKDAGRASCDGAASASANSSGAAPHAAYGQKALQDELASVQAAAPGSRNVQLNRSAFNLGQLIGAGALDRELVRTELLAAAEGTGLARGEAEATIRSGLAAGMKSPRVIPETQNWQTSHSTRTAGSALGAATGNAAGQKIDDAPRSDGASGSAHGAASDDADGDVLGRLLASLRTVPLLKNGKPDRDQLEAAALPLIEDAALLTEADLLRLRTELKQLGAAAKFVDAFGRAVRDARQRLVMQQIENDDAVPRPEGWPYAAEYGRTYLLGLKTDRQGSKQIVRLGPISEFAAQIVEEAVSEEGQRSFVIVGETVEGVSLRLEISASDFADDRALKAALTTAAGANAPIHAGMVRHVGPAIQLLSDPEIPTVRRYERTGWASGQFLIPGCNREGVRIALPSKLPYNLPGGDHALALECLRLTFNAVRPEQLTVLLSFALQAPFAYLAGWREERYGILIAGRSGTLKTTTAKHLLAIFGPRFQHDEYLLKFGQGSTFNALIRLASHAHDLPFLVDNYKPSTGNGSRDLITFTHAVLEGGDRERLTRSAQLREARPIFCWPLMTGEDIPAADPASLARLLIVNFHQDTVDPARWGEAQALVEHLHGVGALWIDWLETAEGQRYGQWARDQFPDLRQRWANHLRSAAKNAVNRLRLASNLATNQLAFQVMSHHPLIGRVVEPYTEYHHAGLALIAQEMAQSTGQGLEAQRFLDTLRELLASGRYLLLSKDAQPEGSDRDRVLGWEDADGIYLLPDLARQAVARVLGNDVVNSLSSMTLNKQMAELGLIASSNAERHTKRLRRPEGSVTTIHLKREALLGEEGSDVYKT